MATVGEDGLNLTPQERQKLCKFKENVSDVIESNHDNRYLIRWLTARAFDLAKSEDMLRKHLEWRKKFNIANIITDFKPPEVLERWFPGGLTGFDKEGCPVWITPSGGLDMKGLTLSAKRSDIIMYNLAQVESTCSFLQVQTRKLGRPVEQVILIDDFEGFTMRKLLHPGMDLLLKIMAIIEANYPEVLKKCYIINAPRWWSVIFNICKPFLSEDTKKKIVLLGSDWKERLMAEIDPDQLPARWGGTRPMDVEDSRFNICLGGEVPFSYYLREQCLLDPDKWTTVTLAAGSQLDLEFNVTEPKSLLKWLFKTEGHDLAFGLTYVIETSSCDGQHSTLNNDLTKSGSKEFRGQGNPRIDLIPMSRINCHVIPEDGYWECDQTGTYVIHFSNKHSWMTTKNLQYYIQVLQPEETLTDVTPSSGDMPDDL